MNPTFTSQVAVAAFPTLKDDVRDIQQAVNGPCLLLTQNQNLLFLRAVYLYKTYFAFCQQFSQYREYFLQYRAQLKMLSLIHALRSFDIFIYNIDYFYQLFDEFNNNSDQNQVSLERFGYQSFKQNKASIMGKTEEMDRIMSGLIKCKYARGVDYDAVKQVELFCYERTTLDEDKKYLSNIFNRVDRLYVHNMLYNMHCHRLQPNEVVMAIVFSLDKDEKEFLTNIGHAMLKPYGCKFDEKLDTLVSVSGKILMI